jgi:hypothetical protein
MSDDVAAGAPSCNISDSDIDDGSVGVMPELAF